MAIHPNCAEIKGLEQVQKVDGQRLSLWRFKEDSLWILTGYVSIPRGQSSYHFVLGNINNMILKVNIPLDLRYEPTSMETFPELGTGFTVVNACMPTRTEGAIPGLWAVHQSMEELKGSCDPVVMYSAIHYLMTLLPSCLCQWLVRTVLRSASLSFCSLPGPERHVMLASCRLKSVSFWMNSHPDVPVAFCVFSYAGNFYVGVSADSGTIASPKILVKGFTTHLDRMYSIVAKRKIPGQERRRSSFTAERRREEIFKPSVKEINAKLHVVQDELHEIARKLEVMSIPGYVHPSESAPAPVYQKALHHRMEELKEEFVELITELRKRKTVAGGIIIDVEDVNYDHDLDGELRRPKRMLSNQSRRPSFTALTTLLSTSRPLLTQYAPSAAHQSLYYVPSDPDLEVRTTPEQQRALLARSNEAIPVLVASLLGQGPVAICHPIVTPLPSGGFCYSHYFER
ncbi:WS_DGAT_C domain-containing protein [Caerostris darwini]|uniref:WS_DGAT_C domain-containing protein n=1 Tax=Caerostris darwini TaxID=1538125 RepID=A0AAV4SC86_9ARAC|nr:WS_DGAT_C domain-containing protein [Caerostris darwini]